MARKSEVLFFAVGLLLATAPVRAQNFQGLGFLPGFDYSEAAGVSADGKTVAGNLRPIGHETSGNSEAFSWTASTGVVALGFPTGNDMSRALGVSGDGTTFVGYGVLLNSGTGARAFKWTSATGFVGLGDLPGGNSNNFAAATNADGSVIVGSAVTGCCAQAIRWTASTGMVNLGTLPGATGGVANGVSGDGSVVVGYSSTNEAFRWTATTGVTGLGFLPGSNNSTATAVSANGSVIIGSSRDQAFRWTVATGMVAIGSLPGAIFSPANAVNADGSVIVGTSGSANFQAYRWTQATGIQSIPAILSAGGYGPTNWSLQTAQGVSADGTVIVGNGIDPNGKNEAWIARIPVNAFALLDLNGVDHSLGSLVWGGVVTNSGLGTATLSAGSDNTNSTFIGTIQDGLGSTAFVKTGTGTLTLTGASTYTGATTVNGGTLEIGNGGSIANSSSLTNTAKFVVDGGGSATFGSVTNAATGAITVAAGGAMHDDLSNAGTVTNNGAYFANVASNTGTITNNGTWTGNVNNTGGAFLGIGSVVGNVAIGNSAVFAPGSGTAGSSMTINGSLAFSSGAFYQVAINPTTASFVNITGSATLGGASVQAVFSSGTYVAKQYTIVNAAGGVNGTFNSLANTNLPSGFTPTLSYDGTHAFLNLPLNFVPPPGGRLSGNQQSTANAILNFFNRNGSIPIVFGALTPSGLTQLSGEGATASQQTTFDAMNQFLGALTDPFIAGRGDPLSAGGSTAGYAGESMAYAAKRSA